MGLAAEHPAAVGLLSTRFPATADAVRGQLSAVSRLFEAKGLTENLRSDVAIVLGEVLNNIVEHSVANRDGSWIGLEVLREDGGVQIETVDRGRPLPPQLLASATLPERPVDIPDLPEGGFGWFIIHSLAQDMVYERSAGTNRLSFFLEGK